MSILGTKRLPCGHAGIRPPTAPGRYERRCRICRVVHTLVVEPAEPDVRAKVGADVLRARWDTEQRHAA